jgi:hypothetical protein
LSGRTTPDLKFNCYSFWIIGLLAPVSVTTPTTVVDVTYAIAITVNSFVIVSKTPDFDLVFSVFIESTIDVTVAHGVESVITV